MNNIKVLRVGARRNDVENKERMENSEIFEEIVRQLTAMQEIPDKNDVDIRKDYRIQEVSEAVCEAINWHAASAGFLIRRRNIKQLSSVLKAKNKQNSL